MSTNTYCQETVNTCKLCVKEGLYPLQFPYKQNYPDYKIKDILDRSKPQDIEHVFHEKEKNIAFLFNNQFVDIDLDMVEAREIGQVLLSNTTWTIGRSLNGDQAPIVSHAFFKCDDFTKTLKISIPPSIKEDGDKPFIIEMLGGKNHHALLPPSVNKSGMSLKWHSDPTNTPIKKIDIETIKGIVKRIAGGAVLARVWNEGSRHYLNQALTECMLKAGWADDDIYVMLWAIMQVAGDEDYIGEKGDTRTPSIESTINRHKAGESNIGISKVREILGNELTEFIKIQWELELIDNVSFLSCSSSSSCSNSIAPSTPVNSGWGELDAFPTEPDFDAACIPFPFESLGSILGPAAKTLAEQRCLDPGSAAFAILGAATSITHSRWNVYAEPDQATPLSLFLLAIEESGHGKTRAEEKANRIINKYLLQDIQNYQAALKNNIFIPSNTHIIKDVSSEGVLRYLKNKCSYITVRNSDAAGFFHGYAMREGNATATGSTFSELWSGSPTTKVRGNEDEPIVLIDRRLNLVFAIQPTLAGDIINDKGLQGQGFLPRFLPTLARKRKITIPPRWKDNLEWLAYESSLNHILSTVDVITDIDTGCITFRKLNLTNEAYDLWCTAAQHYVDLANNMDKNLKPQYLRGAENILRVAGTMAAIEQYPHVEKEHIKNAIQFIEYTTYEWENIYGRLLEFSAEITEPQSLWDWMCKQRKLKNLITFSIRNICRTGPITYRKAGGSKRANEHVQELVNRGYLCVSGKEFEMRP